MPFFQGLGSFQRFLSLSVSSFSLCALTRFPTAPAKAPSLHAKLEVYSILASIMMMTLMIYFLTCSIWRQQFLIIAHKSRKSRKYLIRKLKFVIRTIEIHDVSCMNWWAIRNMTQRKQSFYLVMSRFTLLKIRFHMRGKNFQTYENQNSSLGKFNLSWIYTI